MTNRNIDYIIIGSGSAGSVLANRLSEDEVTRVLVLEAGGMDHHLFIHMPSALAFPMANPKYTWMYESEPEPGMANRKVHCPRGKTVGGSSSINGMVYIRGHALDYDGWASHKGLENWTYADCLPYFRKSETRAKGGDDYRGDSGPLNVSTGAGKNPLYKAFIDAGVEAGYPYTEDMNGYQQEGLGPMDMTVHQGRRWSTAMAYLRPAMERDNIEIQLNTIVTKIILEGPPDALVAVGVEVLHNGVTEQIRARKEVILCGGAINSPQLLQLSGIGDPEHLKSVGIEVKVNLPGVGQNLQDHVETYVQYECKKPITLYSTNNPLVKAKIGLEWLLFQKGLGATNHFESGGFIRSDAGVKHPDLQYHFLPMAVRYDGSSPVKCHGFQAHVGPMRSNSRGHVKIRSNDPLQAPEIKFNYMSTEQDRKEMRAAIRLTREIFAQKAMDPFRGEELSPGKNVQTDAEIDEHISRNSETAYHPSCTCKMGTDEMAVVDASAKVHGVQNLRVVDASIMPNIVSGNLNVPTIMLAEKLADVIKGVEPLPRSTAPYYVNPNYLTSQR